MRRNHREHLASAIGGLCITASLLTAAPLAIAQEQSPPPSQPPETSPPPATTPPPAQEKPGQDEAGKKQDAPPSLDDLLGIDEAQQDKSAQEAAKREVDEELQRELTEKQIADAFRQAVEKMAISADLLDVRFDPGLGTQRVQEDIIEKLQQLIDQAKKQQSMNASTSSSSSSSSSQNQQQDKQNPGQRGQQQGQQGQQQGQNRTNGTENTGEMDPPPRQEGDLNSVIEETRSEWGNLPERIRNMFLQGRKESFSSLYDRLTSEYYKKLAEDNPR